MIKLIRPLDEVGRPVLFSGRNSTYKFKVEL